MDMIKIREQSQHYAFAKDITKIFGYKSPTRILKNFRDFSDKHPNYFYPHKAYIKISKSDTLYDVISFAFYFENRDLLDAGTRSLNFKKDLPRLREVYLYPISEEVQ